MPLWRCQNDYCSTDPHGRLIYDFESEVPVCPKCGADQRTREGAHLIVRRKVMHWEAPHPRIARKGTGHAACNERKRVCGGEFVGFTGDPNAVNCPACQASKAYCEATADREEPVVHPRTDFSVRVDPGQQTLVRDEDRGGG